MKRIMVTDTRSHFVQCWTHMVGNTTLKGAQKITVKTFSIFISHNVFAGDSVFTGK